MVAIRELKGLKIFMISNLSLDFHNKLPENPLSLIKITNFPFMMKSWVTWVLIILDALDFWSLEGEKT
jgi:hypothetical protein